MKSFMIPVPVDAVAKQDGRTPLRCVYFTIQLNGSKDPVPVTLEGILFPLLLLHFDGAIALPFIPEMRLDSPDQIDKYFREVMKTGATVGTASIWLPDKPRLRVGVGTTFRIPDTLFTECFRMGDGMLNDHDAYARLLPSELFAECRVDAAENRAFRQWRHLQMRQ